MSQQRVADRIMLIGRLMRNLRCAVAAFLMNRCEGVSDAHHGIIKEAEGAGLSHQSRCSGGSEVTLALHLVASVRGQRVGGGRSELKRSAVMWVGVTVMKTDEGGS